jgi:cell division protein FtsZ
MGIGQASGENRAVTAAKAAIASPLLEAAIDGARGILLNITGPSGWAVRDERRSGDHPRGGSSGREHHLRHGDRRRDGRRGQGDRDRRRVRPLGRRRPVVEGAAEGVEQKPAATLKDLFADDAVDPLEGEDDFDVPSFLK